MSMANPPPLTNAPPGGFVGGMYPGQNTGPVLLCPNCRRDLPLADGPAACPFCGWKGEAHLFRPLPISVDRAEQALPEDASCLHHPSKRATAICAGTGDYICSLCAVDLNGQTYSAQYLSTGGKEKVGRAFDRYLERPDSLIVTCMVLSFVPPLCYVMAPGVLIWLPWSIYLYSKALKLRQSNPLYAQVVTPGRMVAIPIALALITLAMVGMLIAMGVGIYSEITRF